MTRMTTDGDLLRRELTSNDLFTEATLDRWRAMVQRTLGGRSPDTLAVATHEGIAVDPLYTEPGTEQLVEPRPERAAAADPVWQPCQRARHADPLEVAAQLNEEADRGVAAVWIPLDRTVRLGLEPDDPRVAPETWDGAIVATVDHFNQLLENVDLERTAINTGGGGNALAVAAAVLASCKNREDHGQMLRGAFHCDPLGALAADGELPCGLDRSLALLADLAAWAQRNSRGLTTVAVSTLPYTLAGATAVHELAYSAATSLAYLRAMTDRGLGLEAAGRQIRFVIAPGRDLFLAIAKLRALRRLWARIIEASGGEPEARSTFIHAVTSPRSLTVRSLWTNQLRATVESFAAVVGGADALTVLPVDGAHRTSSIAARRMAALTHAVLRDESHLHRVADPAGGSWYVERLTDQLARKAWSLFQEVEASGGMAQVLLDGSVRRRLADTLAARTRALVTRADLITGVSSYPDVEEVSDERPPIDSRTVRATCRQTVAARTTPNTELARVHAALATAGDGSVTEAAVAAMASGATLSELAAALRDDDQPARTEPLPRQREAELFEQMRDASDAWLKRHGRRPAAAVVRWGPASENRAQVDFAVNLLAVGGLEAMVSGAADSLEAAVEAFAETGTSSALLCSDRATSSEAIPELAQNLKRRGALRVYLVAAPGGHEGEWRAAGVDGFLCEGCDVHQALRDLLATEGVTP
jgi:methylmalonyl-CoA mutase